MPDPSPASPDCSFNTDRLESLQSAEHIRQSMQKYLADKHEHLKKTSQLLADKTGANPGAQQPENTSHSVGSRSRPTSFVRSLEDLRSVDTGSVYSNTDLDLGPPSLPVNPHLPLARFLYSSDSNLSQLEVPPLDLANHPLTKWQEAQGSYSKTVLRPCDQYPELAVVRRREGGRSGASSQHSYRASVHVESSHGDERLRHDVHCLRVTRGPEDILRHLDALSAANSLVQILHTVECFPQHRCLVVLQLLAVKRWPFLAMHVEKLHDSGLQQPKLLVIWHCVVCETPFGCEDKGLNRVHIG